jgi:YARHG domain
MKIFACLVLLIIVFGCSGEIKNQNAQVIEEDGTTVDETTELKSEDPKADGRFIGFWVGDFEPNFDRDDEVDEQVFENSEFERITNKINISIDSLDGKTVYGHSVVAGNDRPFKGEMQSSSENDQVFSFHVKEPGDHKSDGVFSFKINLSEEKMIGTWEAYKKERVYKRKYDLTKKEYKYDPSIMLSTNNQFINWRKSVEETVIEEYDGETEEWVREKFSTSTQVIFEKNASKRLLKKKEVENLTKGDLEIIRNTIYARHGYSFKNKVYRNFFDLQDWYIPVHADIKKELTEIEKENIKLLMRYEKKRKGVL